MKMEGYLTSKDTKVRTTWSRLLLGYAQIWGLLTGYTNEMKIRGEWEKKKLFMHDLLILQADGELPELLKYFDLHKRKVKTQIGDKNYFKKVGV